MVFIFIISLSWIMPIHIFVLVFLHRIRHAPVMCDDRQFEFSRIFLKLFFSLPFGESNERKFGMSSNKFDTNIDSWLKNHRKIRFPQFRDIPIARAPNILKRGAIDNAKRTNCEQQQRRKKNKTIRRLTKVT